MVAQLKFYLLNSSLNYPVTRPWSYRLTISVLLASPTLSTLFMLVSADKLYCMKTLYFALVGFPWQYDHVLEDWQGEPWTASSLRTRSFA